MSGGAGCWIGCWHALAQQACLQQAGFNCLQGATGAANGCMPTPGESDGVKLPFLPSAPVSNAHKIPSHSATHPPVFGISGMPPASFSRSPRMSTITASDCRQQTRAAARWARAVDNGRIQERLPVACLLNTELPAGKCTDKQWQGGKSENQKASHPGTL